MWRGEGRSECTAEWRRLVIDARGIRTYLANCLEAARPVDTAEDGPRPHLEGHPDAVLLG
jgi:hypothetical protein